MRHEDRGHRACSSPEAPRASARRPRARSSRAARAWRSTTCRARRAPSSRRSSAGARASSPGDVTDEAQVGDALDAAIAAFGPLRGLVNCAGIGSASRTVGKDGEPFRLDVFRRTIEVNLIGTFNVIRLAAARMVEERARRRRRARRDRQHRVDRRVRGPDRPGRLLGVEGRRRRHDAADRARPRAPRDPRVHDRAGPVQDAAADEAARAGARGARPRSIPFPSRLGEPAEYAALACHILENPMLNGETIRLDGALRMAPQ